MADTDAAIVALNAGEVSRFALGRIDLAKMRSACETQQNFLPHVLGPTFFRPGTAFKDHTKSDLAGRMLEFYFDATTTALLVCTPLIMRVMIGGVYLTRGSVATAITNGGFNTDLSGWTNADEAGATSSWTAPGYMSLLGTGANYANRDQQVTVAGGDANKEHAVRLVIFRGTVQINIGTSVGDNTYIDRILGEGTYSLAFTPTTTFWIRLRSQTAYPSLVDSIAIEAAGTFELPTPWDVRDLANIFYDQSGDILFVAGGSAIQQREIQRLGLSNADLHSWGVAKYFAGDGPFRPVNTGDVTLIPSGTTGNVLLTSSRRLFTAGHAGALFRLTTQGQLQISNLAGAGQQTGNIRVSGVGGAVGVASQRIFSVIITGTFVATVELQRSLGAPGSWSTVATYTGPTSTNYDDGLDNQIVFYRLAIVSTYTSGTAACELSYFGAAQTGIGRITTVNSQTTANCDVLVPFGQSIATTIWSEGEWSSYRGFPTAVALHDGRLFWAGNGVKIWGSVSDAFRSFDDTVTGDSAPISRSVATGGLDGARWLLSLQRLIGGTAAQEISIRSSAFDEPLTPTAFVARACSTRGAFRVRPIRVDSFGVFVERNGQRVFELAFDLQKGDYASKELTRLKQEMCASGVKSVAVQRQPDTRIWLVLNSGSAVCLTYEKEDDVAALTPVTTNGTFEEVAVLPGTDEDDVYFIVVRGSSRFVEKLAKRSEAGIAAVSKCMDCHVFAAGPTSSVSFSHMPDGTSVVAWANGVPLPGPFTVSGGAVALGGSFSNVTVGLSYTGQIKTAKLAYGAERGSPLEQQKRVGRVGLLMADVAWKGIRIGRDLTNLSGLPATLKGKALAATDTMTAYDARPGSFNGGWDSDARVCVQVVSPYPVTIMGLALEMETNEAHEPSPGNAG